MPALSAALRWPSSCPSAVVHHAVPHHKPGLRPHVLPAALGQVVALLLRSSGRVGEAVPEPEAEFDYPALLNRVLPNDIRVLGWADVDDEFSARSACKGRPILERSKPGGP